MDGAALFLSEESPPALLDGGGAAPAWATVASGLIPRVGLRVVAGAPVVFGPLEVGAGHVVHVTVGRPDGAAGPAPRLVVWAAPDAAQKTSVIDAPVVLADGAAEPWAECRAPLRRWSGRRLRFVVECDGADALVLFEFVVAPSEGVDLARARAFRALRIRNEKANFDGYYRDALFADAPPPAAPGPPDPAAPPAPPAPPSAFAYAHDTLKAKLGLDPPAFGRRLLDAVARAGDRPLRVLSLCSGAARIERDFVRLAPGRVAITLHDVNANLLGLARERLAPHAVVTCLEGDVNDLVPGVACYDVALCVSGLHHVVELERLMERVAASLVPGGEFWSVGETLGRNGGRLVPEAYRAANAWFRRLPARLRRNRMTGRTEDDLVDVDCSVGCFEGIRCEAIEPAILARFAPVHVSRHNVVVWKLFSPSYAANYDLAQPEDLARVDAGVDLDVALHRAGVPGVELHGVYRRQA